MESHSEKSAISKKLKLEPVIGLEIHIQLKTDSKMFSAAPSPTEDMVPNTAIDPVVLGHPGTLPTINVMAIQQALRLSLALNSTINRSSKFDRKHYFYPDLPKGYQITQHYVPLAENGHLVIHLNGEERRIELERLHIEEDAAKNIHRNGKTFVDFNRAGLPLAEIVTRPVITSPAEAKKFLQELQLLARYMNVSDADMEKGHLRCDANISLRPKGETRLYPKTEVKNMNSFRSVERALEYEIARQEKLWQAGQSVMEQTTRGWDDVKQMTVPQRSKEASNDYRYMPEPDLPILKLTRQQVDEVVARLVELPHQKRLRFKAEYELKYSDAEVLTGDPQIATYFEEVMTEVRQWLLDSGEVEGSADEIWLQSRKKLSRMVFSWISTELFRHMKAQAETIEKLKITPENFAEFIVLLHQSKVNSSAAQKIFEIMYTEGGDPTDIAEENDLSQVSDIGALEEIVEAVIAANQEQWAEYKDGKTVLEKFFVGLVMKESKGKANPQIIVDVLKKKLQG